MMLYQKESVYDIFFNIPVWFYPKKQDLINRNDTAGDKQVYENSKTNSRKNFLPITRESPGYYSKNGNAPIENRESRTRI